MSLIRALFRVGGGASAPGNAHNLISTRQFYHGEPTIYQRNSVWSWDAPSVRIV
jgi:hypothetical protein